MAWPHNDPDAAPDADQIAKWQARFAASDRALGIETTPDFRPFNQRNDMFSRAFWDEAVKSDDAMGFFDSYRNAPKARRGSGFETRDFALRNAAWSLSDVISKRSADQGKREGFQALIDSDTLIAPEKISVEDPHAQTAEITRIAKLFGADLVGVSEVDERWHYTHRVDTRSYSAVDVGLPEGLGHVIVMGHAMDFDLVETYPSALASASAGLEYSHEAAITIQLAAYIRGLGYEAVASMNDTALVIPYAIKAGLGEYGRNQMVLTPEFGPRVRFSKVFTNLPLAASLPKPLGLAAYCHGCTVCADACPPKALPKGAPEVGSDSPSTIRGVRKWSADCEKCFGYWAKLKSDCAICMRVCPFNRPYLRWQDRLWRWLATGRARGLARWWQARSGVRKRLRPGDWWARD